MANTDLEKFELLYEKWSEPVYKYLVHLMGYDPLLEDLFQETWAQVMRNRRQLRDTEKFGPWLFSVARNLVFNEFRKKKRIAKVWIFSNLEAWDDRGGPRLMDVQADHAPGPDEATITGERRKLLNAALAEMDPQTQEILQLRYFEHFSLPEIARIMMIPLGTVCTKAHRGLQKVRLNLEARGISNLEQI